MLKLRTLGTLQILDSVGEPVQGLARHDRRIALLVYLALAAPQAGLRRDLLLSVFWPEQDSAHARSSLRQAIHLLRCTMGNECVLASDGTIRVDHSRIACDATLFDELAACGRFDEALSLYGGPFLQGFFISGAPEFDRWADVQRTSLQQTAIESLIALATIAGHEHENAIRLLNRARELAPFRDDIVCGLMRHHVAAHNPALALTVYQQFVHTMRRDMELDVSHRTHRLAASIREKYQLRP